MSQDLVAAHADIAADIIRVLLPKHHQVFRELLQQELRGRDLDAAEQRRAIVETWDSCGPRSYIRAPLKSPARFSCIVLR
jgi:hypothetical protein